MSPKILLIWDGSDIFLINPIVQNTKDFWGNIGGVWTIPVFMWCYLITPLLNRAFTNKRLAVIITYTSFVVAFLSDKYLNGWLSLLISLPYFLLGYLCKINEDKDVNSIVLINAIALIVLTLMNLSIGCRYGLIFSLVLIALNRIKIRLPVKILDTLDKYSYSFYLVHCIVFVLIVDAFSLTRSIAMVISIIGSVVLSVIANKIIEEPATKYLKKQFNVL